MKDIHPLVWAGFALNLCLVGFMMYALSGFVPTETPAGMYVERVLTRDWRNLNVLYELLPVFRIGLLLQALTIVFLLFRIRGGVILGCVGGLLMLPLGLIFAEGSLLTHNRVKYAPFKALAHEEEPAVGVYPFSGMHRSVLPGAGILAVGVFFFVSYGITGTAGVAFLAGLLLLGRTMIARRRPLVTLHKHYLTVTPNIWSENYTVPYEKVKKTVKDWRNIYLTVEVGREERVIGIPVRSMPSLVQEQAPEAILACVEAKEAKDPGEAGEAEAS